MRENKILDDFARRVMQQIESTGRKILGFKWDITYNDSVRDYWPIGPGPGFNGRVWIRYDKPYQTFASEPFGVTGTYPGTGGGGSYNGPWKDICEYAFYADRLKLNIDIPKVECFSWDYRFIFNHPKVNLVELATLIKESATFEELAGRKLFPIRHCFEYEDTDTTESDLDFILKVKEIAGDRVEKIKALGHYY